MKFNARRTILNLKNTIKLTKKSDKEVYLQHLRLVLFGVAAVGTIGFGIQLYFLFLHLVDKIVRDWTHR